MTEQNTPNPNNTPKPKPRKTHRRSRKIPTLEDALVAVQAATIAFIAAYKLLKPFIKRVKKKK